MRGPKGIAGFTFVFALGLLSSCASTIHNSAGVSNEATAESYAQGRATRGCSM